MQLVAILGTLNKYFSVYTTAKYQQFNKNQIKDVDEREGDNDDNDKCFNYNHH